MDWDTAGQTHLTARRGYSPRWLLYVYALETDRSNAPIGVWSGDYDITMTVDGTSRDYVGAADGMVPDQIVFEKGTTIRKQTINLHGVNPQAQEMVRGRIIRGRAAELHLALFDPFSDTIISYSRVFKGFVNRAPINIGAMGATTGIKIELVSSMRTLSKSMALKKSDASMKKRNADSFRKYGSIATQVQVEWWRE